jgi:hypothetical protein
MKQALYDFPAVLIKISKTTQLASVNYAENSYGFNALCCIIMQYNALNPQRPVILQYVQIDIDSGTGC